MVITSPFYDIPIQERTLHDEVFRCGEMYGIRKALVCGTTGRTYTYPQVKQVSKRIASGLVKQGMKKGTVVAILAPNLPEYGLCVLGITSGGGTFTTMNPIYTPREIFHQLSGSNVEIVFTVKGFEKILDDALSKGPHNVKKKILIGAEAPGYVPFTTLAMDDGSAFPHNLKFDVKNDTVAILYSSGTTGLPKGVMITHYSIVTNFYQALHPDARDPIINYQNPDKHETSLAILPMFHAFGLTGILLGGLIVGNTIVTLSKFEPEPFLNAIQKHKVSELFLVPPIVIFMAKHPMVLNYDLSSVKRVICGAAPLSVETEKEFMERVLVKRLLQGYGMTEMTFAVTQPDLRRIVKGSSGVLSVKTEMMIIDLSTGKEVGEGERGEIWIRGPQRMKGYYNNPKATEETIDKDGWLHTGDVGYVDSTGNLFIVDRIKELIKYKAFQVAPAELEALLLTHPSVADSAVIGLPDKKAGELPRAYIVKKPGEAVTEKEIHAFVKENAAPFKQLRGGVIFTEAIPKSPSGKILRRVLVERATKSKM